MRSCSKTGSAGVAVDRWAKWRKGEVQLFKRAGALMVSSSCLCPIPTSWRPWAGALGRRREITVRYEGTWRITVVGLELC